MQYRRARKKTTLQLTSLLDLLFLMIFVSLLQSKDIPSMAELRQAQATPPPAAPAPPAPPAQRPTEPSPPQRPTMAFVQATFHFHPTPNNPNIAKGTYKMHGQFHRETRLLELGGVTWVDRPENYDMVPLRGVIEVGEEKFTGRIEFPGCEQFTLTRTDKSGRTEFSGRWEGVYSCSQGETGLVLTIE